MRRTIILLTLAVLWLAACGEDAGTPDTTATDDTSVTTEMPNGETSPTTEAGETTSTTGAPSPGGPAFVLRGETGHFVGALQVYLNCTGYGPLQVDGIFGSGTAGAVEMAQDDRGVAATGEPDEETFAWLARGCFDVRTILSDGEGMEADVAGNAAPGDDEIFEIELYEGQSVTLDVAGAVDIAVQAEDGTVLHRPDGSTQIVFDVAASQEHTIRVSAAEPTSFEIRITIPGIDGPGTTTTTLAGAAGFLLAADGFNDIDFGTESGETVTYLVDLFGPPVADTGFIEVEQGPDPCGTVERAITWEFPATADNAATVLEVIIHDRGYSNPAFAHWDYRLANHEDRDQAGPGILASAHGMSPGISYNDAVALGFELGGYEELSHGDIDGIFAWAYEVTDYEVDGWISSMAAGEWACPSQV